MPVGALATSAWYGPGAISGVARGPGLSLGGIKGTARLGGEGASAGFSIGRANRLQVRAGQAFGAANVTNLSVKGTARLNGVARVGEFTQGDVSAGILTAPLEGGLTVGDALRLLLAQAAGDATGLDGGTITFKSVDGSKTRVAGTISAGNRTITTLDAA